MKTRIPAPPATMRKQPRQARSRASVAAIVEAGAQVLGRGGWAAFNTNLVAEVAGVSIGTVYQYFPNKAVLVDAIRRRHYEAVLRAVRATGDETRSLRSRIEELVEGLASAHAGAPALHRALLDEAPHESVDEATQAFERAYVAAFQRLLDPGEARVSRVSRGTVEAAASVLAAAVEGMIHDAARQGAAGRARVMAEQVRLVRAYVQATRRRLRSAVVV